MRKLIPAKSENRYSLKLTPMQYRKFVQKGIQMPKQLVSAVRISENLFPQNVQNRYLHVFY